MLEKFSSGFEPTELQKFLRVARKNTQTKGLHVDSCELSKWLCLDVPGGTNKRDCTYETVQKYNFELGWMKVDPVLAWYHI